MWNKPGDSELAKLPAFYSTEEVPPREKIIAMHFFIGDCDWYAAEYSPEEHCFFGFTILNGDLDNAEWGYFSLRELSDLKVAFLEVDRDLHFKPCRAIEIEKICEAQEWEEGGEKGAHRTEKQV